MRDSARQRTSVPSLPWPEEPTRQERCAVSASPGREAARARWPLTLISCALAGACLPVAAAPPRGGAARAPRGNGVTLVTSQTPLWRIPAGLSAFRSVASPDARRVALLARSGGGAFVVVVDGAAGRTYDRVPAGPAFCPDGKRVLYAAERTRKQFVVVDGAEGKPYDQVFHAAFSAEGRHVAYLGRRGTKLFVVLDGTERGAFDWVDGVVFPPVLSPDGKRLAYVAVHGRPEAHTARVTVDGLPAQRYDAIAPGSLVLSPDGKRVAYVAYRKGKGQCVVVDGVEGTWHDGIPAGARPVFSPDGRRLAYAAQRGTRMFVVADGKEHQAHSWLDAAGIVFSPDGRRLAYSALRPGLLGDRHFVVLDGVRQKTQTGSSLTSLTFSPDSRRVAYVVWRSAVSLLPPDTGYTQSVVVDGAVGKRYDKVAALAFSPNGRRVAYVAFWGTGRLVVVDGREGKPFALIAPPGPLFSPDGRHVAYAACTAKGQARVVIDGVECKGLSCMAMLFEGANALRVVGRDDEGFVLTKIRIVPRGRTGRDRAGGRAAS